MLTFIETPLFTSIISDHLDDDEYRKLQTAIAENPESGALIRGSGGVRKLRWAGSGRGKRGGLRVIYYYASPKGEVWMLTLYPKNVRKISPRMCYARLRKRLRMPNQDKDRNIGKEILDGIRSIKAGKTGRVTTVPGVAEIRAKTGLSQSQFAKLLNVSVRTLQEWEQGRRAPSGPAKTLLAIAYQNPQALLDVAV